LGASSIRGGHGLSIKLLVVIIGLALTSTLIPPDILLPAKYCNGAQISESDLATRVAAQINDRSGFPISIGTTEFVIVRYKNAADFQEKNPECCKIDLPKIYDLPPVTFIQKITGTVSHTFSGYYRLYYVDSFDSIKFIDVYEDNSLSNCGEFFSMYGAASQKKD